VLGRLLEKPAPGADAGVGAQDVEAADGREGGRDYRLLLRPLGHVRRERERPPGAADVGGEGLQPLAAPRRQGDP
jgi:hypothetical protein